MTSVRDFLSNLAPKLNKQSADMEPFIKVMEDNWFETT